MDDTAPLNPRAIPGEFVRYLRRPQLIRPAGIRAKGALPSTLVMIAIQVTVLLAVTLPVLIVWQKAFDVPSPTAFEHFPKQWLVVFAVLIAPILEEVTFRGWLPGRPRTLAILAALIGAVFAIRLLRHGGAHPLLTVGGALAALALGAVIWFVLRKRAAPGWWQRGFPIIFYLAALIFAAVHITNYPLTSWVIVPMVLPQAWAALTLGFTRMRIGLPASIATHVASNAVAMAAATIFH